MPVSDDFLTAGLKITGHFEDSADPLAAVSGNFDGQGLLRPLLTVKCTLGSGNSNGYTWPVAPHFANTSFSASIDGLKK